MFCEVMGFREGVLVLPNDRPLPIRIDCAEMSRDTIPEMRISVIPGVAGHHLIDDYKRRQRAREFLYKPFNLAPFGNPEIKKVIFNDPATVVIWSDDSKTVVKCQPGDTYDAEKGLALCISKKYLGNKGNFNEVFKKWIPEEPIETISVKDIIEEVSVSEMVGDLYKFCNKAHSCTGCIFEPEDSCHFAELSEEEVKQLYKKVNEKGGLK